MNWFEALVLGIIQGLTEFLPVSSSGHLEIAKSLFGVNTTESFYFTVAVHGATVLSTIFVLWKEILSLIKGSVKFSMNEDLSYIIKIVISMIPVGFIGLFMKDYVEDLFSGNIVFVGFMLMFTAVLLAIGHLVKRKERSINYIDSLVIGIAQAIAVIPGISRSGATIATGLMLGNKKSEIAKFSFLMVLIPVIGANLVDMLSDDLTGNGIGLWMILIGSLAAFVSGYIACKWMINLVKRSKMIWFSVYCAIIGIMSVILG